MKAEAQIIQPPVESLVQLTLTMDEARTLQEVMWHVGGHSSGRRGHIDNIRNALASVGVSRPNSDCDRAIASITFRYK